MNVTVPRPGGLAAIIGMVPMDTRIEPHGRDVLQDREIQGATMRQPLDRAA